MKRYLGISSAFFCAILVVASTALARPGMQQRHYISQPDFDVDIVGDRDGTEPAPQKALADTVWIADWGFDGGFPCQITGWQKADNRILNNGSVYWHFESSFSGTGGIQATAAALGYHNNNCCEGLDGYDNDWYQGIRMTYSGVANLSFDFLVDSESGFDFLQVEADSACASYARVNLTTAPNKPASDYRSVLYSATGFNLAGDVNNLALPNFGAGTHCVYIAFFADGGYSPCDGNQPSTIGEAVVVDNIVLVDGSGTRTENFDDGDLDFGWTFQNMQDNKPFGEWARIFRHVTDNDICSENTTCAWLWSDYSGPTVANDPSMSFGPDGFVTRNWLDDVILSPWVSLASTPASVGTVLRFRRFPGNFFSTSRIVQNWSVRGKRTVGGTTCITNWGHSSFWNSLSFFGWIDAGDPGKSAFDATAYFHPSSTDIQIRFRASDWQWIANASAPSTFIPGPGPFIDRVRIGRRVLTGPVINEGIDSRSQAQDCFPTEIHPGVTPAGEHYRPTTDRFGTCAFSEGTELGINKTSPNLITGDSVTVEVEDARQAGGIVSVNWYGAIVAGPHAGKAPAPYTVGANGFFAVPADSARTAGGAVIVDSWFVDLDDTYFRGGDVLNYFWLANDAGGGVTSDPPGLTAVPVSVAAAQLATGGMIEASFLPAITWSPAYLARIAADPTGDLDPTPAELSASSQKNCILYVQQTNTRRKSGDVNRTSFMYTLDRLGYRGSYDVYDHQGLGNTNNQLGGRATIQQAQGYNLIVYDMGNGTPTGFMLPDGTDLDAQKVDQATWFRNWLAQASISSAHFATLWAIGANLLEEKPTNALFASNMGVVLTATTQNAATNPNVAGQVSFTFSQNNLATCPANFSGDQYSLNGGCPVFRDYDALGTVGTAVATHKYKDPRTGTVSTGAIVMRANPAESWNTILQSHAWFDIANTFGTSPSGTRPERVLAQKILNCALPVACQKAPNPTDVPGDGAEDVALPHQSALYQNIPNPFNPVTTIRFDLAQPGRVRLRIYDVAGRVVRTLLDQEMKAGANQSVVWNGLDDAGKHISTGVYFYRLDAADLTQTRKMIMMK